MFSLKPVNAESNKPGINWSRNRKISSLLESSGVSVLPRQPCSQGQTAFGAEADGNLVEKASTVRYSVRNVRNAHLVLIISAMLCRENIFDL